MRCARTAFARYQAEQLMDQARYLLWSCERECDYAALLLGEARAQRAALARNARLFSRRAL